MLGLRCVGINRMASVWLFGLCVIWAEAAVPTVFACTTAVVSGRATVDGRPILWKNRDTSAQHNNVVLLSEGPVADPLTDPRGGEIGEIALTLRDWSLNVERDGVSTRGLPGIWTDLWKLEDEMLAETLELKERLASDGLQSTASSESAELAELAELQRRFADRAMVAMEKELIEAKELALEGFGASLNVAVPPIRVAVYDHSSGDANGPKYLLGILERDSGFEASRISPKEIVAGQLSAFDVLIMPGGSGSKQASMLGEQGREVVRQFVRDGGGHRDLCGSLFSDVALFLVAEFNQRQG